jgi:imidazolonepropionase-like amidohydrolase
MPGEVSKSVLPIYDMLPVNLKRYYKSGFYIGSESETETYRKSYLNMLKMLKHLYDNNIPMVIGSDGGFVAHEMELFSEAGIPNADVIRIATYEAARISNMLDDYGSIEAGKFANLIIIDGDPVSNMKDIRKISVVIKQGKYYNPAGILNYFGYSYTTEY